MPAGNYQWLRLKVLADQSTQNESDMTLSNGSQYPLYIDNVTVSAGTTYDRKPALMAEATKTGEFKGARR